MHDVKSLEKTIHLQLKKTFEMCSESCMLTVVTGNKNVTPSCWKATGLARDLCDLLGKQQESIGVTWVKFTFNRR